MAIHERLVASLVALCMALLSASPVGAADSQLRLVSKIPLGEVRGRIDHLAVDLNGRRLFVAEFGNDTVGVVDLGQNTVSRSLCGLYEPQGIGFASDTDTVYVANAGDGTVQLFQGEELKLVETIRLGSDADNVRVDADAHRVYVGYGNGAIAVMDSSTRAKVAEIRLNGHPESFQLQRGGPLIFVNVPDAHEAVLDRASRRQVAAWPTGDLGANYPMALDQQGGHLAVSGARTGLFVPELDELFLAVRAARGVAAAVWVFHPLRP